MLLRELREEVCRCNLELPANDLVRMTSGNVSGRDPETNLVAIKPSGIPYAQLTPEKMIVVTLEGNVVDGDLVPSIDTPTHLTVYRHRPDVGGVVHTHSPYASSFAVLGQPIPACLTTCGLVGGEIPLGGYYPPVGDEAIGEEMLRVIGSSLAVIMRSHGVFTIGRNAAEATRVAVEVEEIAKIAHLAMLRGTPIQLTPEQVEQMILNYRTNYGQVERRSRVGAAERRSA
jgi:L-ribulose-5-phosphate 4-epimerase